MNDRHIHRRIWILAMACAACLTGVFAAVGQTLDPDELEYPPLHEVVVPEVQRVTLPNGMRLFLLEDHELPLIYVSALIRVGAIYEPADKVGLADITGEVMRTGGTTSKTGDELDEELEQIAASVETSIGRSSGSASVSVLKGDIDRALAILADVLMHPAFPQGKIDLAKMQHASAISRRNDTPAQIASREFRKLIYGPESPYARQTEYATIGNITRDDLMAFHQRFFGPDNMLLAVWGDFDAEQMKAKIQAVFADWEKIGADLPARPEVDYAWQSSVNLITKPDINQSSIYLGHIGGLRSDPDYFALTVMNQILGGGFTGRLFKNVRSRQGLAYSVFGQYACGYESPGLFYVGCQTKSGRTVHAIRAMIAEIEKISQEEVTDEELELAKESYLNSFVFNFDSKGEIIQRLMIYEYYGYPPDFLQKTQKNVARVTKEDILRVAKAHLHPDQLKVLVVGQPDDFDEPLSELGDVSTIDITIPAP